jgi:2,5-diamino-6-(ribosylamino)-4(3H)-pyrimidinone 5'-phosphate reductase
MKPKVILYNAISLDGRITGFPVDMGLFYSLVGQWGENATLVGCDTLLSAPIEDPQETSSEAVAGTPDPDDRRPILVVPDSRGRFKNWHFLKVQPYWKDWAALCTTRTPSDHLNYLKQQGIHMIMAGTEHVDFAQAMEKLNLQFGITVIRADSGGTLNGVLLRAGLVDQVHLLVHPILTGGLHEKTFYTDNNPDRKDTLPLQLLESKRLDNGLLLLSYSVTK